MALSSRWPLAAVCLMLGAAIATFATNTIYGQATVPVPPPASQPLPVPAPLPDPVLTPIPAPAPLAVPQDLTSYRDVVKRALPAVVSIEAKSVKRPANGPAPKALPPGVSEEFRRFFEGANDPAAPSTESNLGFGSGVVIDSSGIVLTSCHVVDGSDSVDVTLHDGRVFTSRDIRKDPKSDLAIVKLTADRPLPALAFGDSDAMEVGDRVLAVGAPFGLTGSVTSGIISAKSRQNLKLNQYEDFLQTDAAVNPGNSGGPLISLDGRVIGINSAIKTRSGGFQGVGLAISSNLAKDVVAKLQKDGLVRRGFLGVGVRELDDPLAARLGVAKGTGAVVSQVYANSPAAKAGVQPGDVITSVASVPVKELNTVPRIVAGLPLNQPTELGIVRDRKPIKIIVTIEEQPGESGGRGVPVPPAAGVSLPNVGITVSDLTPELVKRFGYQAGSRGAFITVIEPGRAAAVAGLTTGQVIVKVDKSEVRTAREFADAVGTAAGERGALLHLLRPSGEVDFAVLKVK